MDQQSKPIRRVTNVVAKPGYSLVITFGYGSHGSISNADRLFGPLFAPLKEPDYFSQAQVDEFGAVCWPNGTDLAPDALYRDITLQNGNPAEPEERGLI